jgi:hypothetical protein
LTQYRTLTVTTQRLDTSKEYKEKNKKVLKAIDASIEDMQEAFLEYPKKQPNKLKFFGDLWNIYQVKGRHEKTNQKNVKQLTLSFMARAKPSKNHYETSGEN